ncbi:MULTISPECIES: sensor histidine kinase [Clostridium]|uniref:sensor histidine kinase n=1 Tax=Clostridium TaxID=1485 RepID=UPI0002CA8F3C|nr:MULTISPECIES: ATP-binding protein [Clostridium]ALP91819.1 PAS domain-containing sensor histidine kinase [Clostridium butyricum]ALS18526.1 PAS domain-containing sensor histidine kinase [Clostridium butyricum]ANF15661.1 PAS domain-containing sensor histidine kinase [Clostridium butyricum]AOR95603.1 PAS domain-containing sensor histidine kinase [Clostridium butyricum]AXB86611.1 sensor histidine kinase [Clostridium butyricum]
MKNKILSLVIITVLSAILMVTCLFTVVTNVEQIKSTKDSLKSINFLIAQSGNEVTDKIKQYDNIKINEMKLRFTLIKTDGSVVYDSESNTTENHSDRDEVIQALEYGEGYVSRYSKTMDLNYIYYATKINDDLIIRSSVPVNTIKLTQRERIKYYIPLVFVTVIFSIFLSLRLVRKIVEPVKELESVTLKMANGDYKIRAKVNSNDELGILGDSFNHMADELQLKIQEVVNNQTKLESIFNSMDSGVVAVDNENNVISINPAAELLLGIKKSIVGEKLTDYVSDHEINGFLMDSEEEDKEITILHPIERNIKIKKSEMIDKKINLGKVISFQDITDMKRVELMRSQFVANVSHELKTPLTSIKGFAETLRIVDDSATREKFLDIIDKEAERLTRLINDILVLSNIESNLVADVEEFRPGIVIEETLNIVRKTARNRNVSVEFEDNSSECILGDRDKFYQLVLNLIENAVKYSKEKEGYVKISSHNDGGYYHLKIQDNGIGIPDEDISRIFERFYRVDKSRKKGGTGLGLAIVKHIVKIFNGEINVKSKLGEGTTFEVKIPYM